MRKPKVSQEKRAALGVGRRGPIRQTEETRRRLREAWEEKKRLIELGKEVDRKPAFVVDRG